jgi:drug/metabolite transporter (DMT)-like permease
MPVTPPSPARTAALTALALVAFAGNSLLCRMALKHTGLDAASFTSLRLASGALVLGLLVAIRQGRQDHQRRAPWAAGDWTSALALFVYAAGFSFAYVSLSAATGALLLFGVVQTAMIGWGLSRGEQLRPLQWGGLATACAGLVWLLLPGLATPSLAAGALMGAAGLGWAVYTLRGRGAKDDPTAVTAGNFLRATPLALAVSLLAPLAGAGAPRIDGPGALLALASGALASGAGYAVWYTALRGLTATRAAILQLAVPAIAAAGGVVLLGEPLTPGLALASLAVLGGVLLVILARPASR